MTEYFEHSDGSIVADRAVTNGIVSEEFLEGTEGIDWKTGINPQILRDVADLVEFCYPDEESGALDIGFLPSYYDPEECPPALVIGHADDDRWVMVAPRLDCRAGPKDDTEQGDL